MPTFPVFINASGRRAKAFPRTLVGFEIIRFFEVKTRDLGLVDKLLDLNAGGSLRSNLAELLVRKDHILILFWLGRDKRLKTERVFKFCFRADRVRSLKREAALFRLLKERVGEHPNIVAIESVYFDEPPPTISSCSMSLSRIWCHGVKARLG